MPPDRRKTLLVVDSDDEIRESLTAALRRDYRVLRAATGEAALQMMQKEDVDLMLLEVHLRGVSGFEVLKIARENYPYVEIIVISKTKELDTAIEAMRHGAYHYISKDFDIESIRTLFANAAERQDLSRDVTRLKEEVAEQNEREFVVGPSRSTRSVVELVQKVAKISATVLVLGESGTGKELLARMIHRESGRPTAPFVAVNLAAIPKELVESALFGHEKGAFTGAIRQQLGKFELAAGGTLFLDEIGDLKYELQAKLLRAIQEEEIERVGGTHPIKTDLRLIAATNVDLEKAVKDGRFREDLYYRLNVIPIRMPALRDRQEDLPELARFFLRKYSIKFRKNVQGIADSTLDILSSYWWPGNIRELENLIERLVAVSDKDWITDEDLPYELHVAKLDTQDQASTENLLERALSTFERNFIVRALEKSSWNVTATSRALGIPLSTLKFKMDKLEIRQLARRIRGN
ncbi:MAG TPA: sigma-54 dependent transcriptional regulator [Vicinamibacterales bacterium]|jgi:DNA-binding NtrC family response regulator|nr:sigma-54 dependent transcriptional regulator [Vicinamibacterales bacterium]